MLDALRAALGEALGRYCREPLHREGMVRALSRPGFALHPQSECRAGALTLLAYEAVGGRSDAAAFKAAAAVELHMEAAYMFDSVADDHSERRHGLSTSEELAIAISCLACGTALSLEAAVSKAASSPCLEAVRELQRSCVDACGGQFLDACLPGKGMVSSEDALRMTALKAGSIGRMAAGFGAGLAGGDAQTSALCGEFGFNLFTYLQLVDDLRDACPKGGVPEDLLQNKKTVPLVFFAGSLPGAGASVVSATMRGKEDPEAARQLQEVFERSGANVFCGVVAEVFLNRAKDNLADLNRRLRTVEPLERFVGSFEVTPKEISALS